MGGGSDLFKELKKTGTHQISLKMLLVQMERKDFCFYKFHQVHCDLQNSARTDGEMTNIKSGIKARISQDEIPEILKISRAIVKAAAITIKKGKGDVSGSYNSGSV